MAKTLTQFSPDKNGFQFVNYFQMQFPVKYKLPIIGEIDLSNVVFGLCGGMCFAALDYYYAAKNRPDTSKVDQIGKKLFTYLCERQLDSLKISVLIKIVEWMMLENNEIATRIARNEAPKLRRMLDDGNPAVLCLIRESGLKDPTHNHQVLAVGYDYDEITRDMQISLYDPNHPCENPSISLNLARPSAGINIAQSTGETLRGFFIVPYSVQKTVPEAEPATAAAGLAFDLMSAAIPDFQLCWPVDSQSVTQKFGLHPEWYQPFGLPGHEGLDLYADTGANVYAAADGEVYQANFPDGNPYGRQIRIKHPVNGKVYHTVYAHLNKIFVQAGQQVKAGDRIGQADNTGNSFGSHLHLTLKLDGAQTPGYPPGVIDPLPYLTGTVPVGGGGGGGGVVLPDPSGITVYTTVDLNLRSGPDTSADVVVGLPSGTALSVLGSAATEKPKIGQQGQWLQVKTASGQAGYVAAWYVQTSDQQAFPISGLIIYPTDSLNLRAGPGTGFDIIAAFTMTDALNVLGDADTARSKIGQQGQWLQVQSEKGLRGFVAAWLVHETAVAPAPAGLTVYPTVTLNVRARASTDSNVLTVVEPGDKLEVLGDPATSRAKIGQQDLWLNVRTPQKFVGYVAAWLVQQGATNSQPAASSLTVYATADVNLRAQGSMNSPRIGGLFAKKPFTVLETDLNAAKVKIGVQDQWVYGETQDGTRGWAAAWFLSLNPS